MARTLEQPEHGCGDFLARMGRKPAHVDYGGCRYEPELQGKPLRATYHVEGRFAAAAEAYLVRAVGLNRLRRACCQWDSLPSQFRDPRAREYSIRMASSESGVAHRRAWRDIETFEIVVETFTEEI